ncbi:MAG TPA: M1 family metallopeptidase, partial [Clostridia bacterium]|nr:M1 family metallopeptidase [Clostridia bacterium]
MRYNKTIVGKLYILAIIFVTFTVSISVHYVLDTGQAQKVFSTFIKTESIPKYTIDVTFDEQNMSLEAKQRVRYENMTEQPIKDLYFHLYANAFRSSDTTPFEAEDMTRAYPNGFSEGWIELISVKKGTKKLNYKIMGKGNTNLRITPKKPIEPGASIELTMKFKVKLPNSIGRMGYGANTVNIANWYPVLSVLDENGWNLEPYHSIGDPFYSNVSEYKVNISIPEQYKLASTGNIIKESVSKNRKTYKIRADNVRDFAFILSEKFSINRGDIDGTEVISYTIGGLKNKQALNYGMEALQIFNGLFGKYPYEQLSIVASDFFTGGMEYPNLVMIGQSLYEADLDLPLEYVIAHEVAHQWWYGIVGNNAITEPWLDEALTEYSTLMYFEEKYGGHIKEQVYERMVEDRYEDFLGWRSGRDGGILRSLDEFDDQMQYSSIVYGKGAMFIRELRRKMGDKAFMSALREYFNTYKFKNAKTENFYDILQKNTNKDLKREFS